ncbi:MAG: hypothetical protein ACRD2L_20800 [Terriglobia bacterium]
MARRWLVAALMLLSGATSGCVTSDTLIRLNPDGSGVVVQKTLTSTQMIAQLTTMMQGLAQQMAGNEARQNDTKMPELFSEKDARARAAKMGEGVRFVSSRKITVEGMEGQEATYAFRDVTKLKLNETPEAPSMPGLQANSPGRGSETTFRFSRLPNGHSELTAVFSQRLSKKASSEQAVAELRRAAQAPTAEQLEQARKFFTGFRIGMVVEVQGNLVKTNSLYREGTKVTLLEMDFSELLASDTLLQQASAIKGQNLEEAKELLKGLKGFKINLDPEISMEFSE